MGTINKKSFTLIELIVAVGVIGLILPTVFNIFFTMIRQQLVLVSYQEIKHQGDSIQTNIKNILQNRAGYISNSDYSAIDVCPLPLTPTPTFSPQLFIKDREGNKIHIYPTPLSLSSSGVASESATFNKIYYLSSKDVSVINLGFSCYKINEFSPVVVSTSFTVQKSTQFKDVTLPYSFKVRLRNY